MNLDNDSDTKTTLGWFQSKVARPLSFIATIVMFSMMALTFFDVAGRYLFSSPVVGAFEMTEVMLAAVIFLGLPLVTSEQSHVTVDIIDTLVSSAFLKRLKQFACVVCALSFSVFAWMLWKHVMKTYKYGDTTAVLHIPYVWLSLLMAVSVSLSAFSLYLILVVDCLPNKNKETK